ncbi:MAG: hypothetical protein GAK30_00151 [Paracidovorax wautersii]|uniref:Uncharacterized protein n=1 Tax=Paracidovorax wautersii TaxID=1177982 RepID=A0A7V8FSJ4_9BURK|nr:MAG: hypothetical protein GAK30_00151 [Paracidovorax wautersii]
MEQLITRLRTLSQQVTDDDDLIRRLLEEGLPEIACVVARNRLEHETPSDPQHWQAYHALLLQCGNTAAAERLREAVSPEQFTERTGLGFWSESIRAAQNHADRLAHTLDRLLAIDPFRLAVRVSTVRRRHPQHYEALAGVLQARAARLPAPAGHAAIALKLALQEIDPHDESHDEALLDLFQRAAIGDVTALLRSAFSRNVLLFQRWVQRLNQTPERLVSISPRGIYRLLAVAYIHLDDDAYRSLAEHIVHLHDAQPPGQLDTPLTATVAIAQRFLARRQTPAPAGPFPIGTRGDRPLRIAIAVSGQLRAYREVFPSWRHLGLDGHQVDYYVHTWKSIGWRFPNAITGNAVDRVFGHAPFVQAYIKAGLLYGIEAMRKAYPTFLGSLERSAADVTVADVQAVYGSDARVYIEAEDPTRFPDDPKNQHKMFYKIDQAQRMVEESGVSYDLVIRLRGDRSFRPPRTPPDYQAMWHQSQADQVLFGEPARIANELYVDDQFAIGTPEVMRAYASTAQLQQQAVQERWHGFTPQLAPHLTLAYALFFQGIRVREALGVRPGPIRGQHLMSRQEIHEALLHDMPGGPRSEMDRLFLEAVA